MGFHFSAGRADARVSLVFTPKLAHTTQSRYPTDVCPSEQCRALVSRALSRGGGGTREAGIGRSLHLLPASLSPISLFLFPLPSARTAGVIVRMERDVFVVLDQSGAVRRVRMADISRKLRDRGTRVLDSTRAPLAVGDVVRILDGPHKVSVGEGARDAGALMYGARNREKGAVGGRVSGQLSLGVSIRFPRHIKEERPLEQNAVPASEKEPHHTVLGLGSFYSVVSLASALGDGWSSWSGVESNPPTPTNTRERHSGPPHEWPPSRSCGQNRR